MELQNLLSSELVVSKEKKAWEVWEVKVSFAGTSLDDLSTSKPIWSLRVQQGFNEIIQSSSSLYIVQYIPSYQIYLGSPT